MNCYTVKFVKRNSPLGDSSFEILVVAQNFATAETYAEEYLEKKRSHLTHHEIESITVDGRDVVINHD